MSILGSGDPLVEGASQAKVTEGCRDFGIINTVSPIPQSLISAVLNPEANLSMYGVILPQLALQKYAKVSNFVSTKLEFLLLFNSDNHIQ